MGDRIETIGLYADDLILYFQDASTSLPAAMQIIETYVAYSGLKINWQKSALMPLYPQEYNRTAAENPLKVVASSKYLGVITTLSLKEVLKANMNSMLNVWAKLPLSVAGRINLIKKILLRKCLYVTSHMPMVVPK